MEHVLTIGFFHSKDMNEHVYYSKFYTRIIEIPDLLSNVTAIPVELAVKCRKSTRYISFKV